MNVDRSSRATKFGDHAASAIRHSRPIITGKMSAYGFFHRQATEEAQLDDAALLRILAARRVSA